MSNTQQNQQQSNEPRKKYQINILEPADFDPGIEESFKTSRRIAMAVNQYLRAGFEDYAGCAVACPIVDGGNRTVMILYPRFYVFAENQYKENKHYAFNPNTLKNDNLVSKVASITSPSPNLKAMVKMTQDGKDVMEDFLFPAQKRNNKIKWEDQYQVSRVNAQTQNGQLVVTFGSLDPIAILRKVYGACDEENLPYVYEVYPIRPLNTVMMNGMQDWMIHLKRAKAGAAERAAADAGIMINLAQQVPMYPAGMTMPNGMGTY